MCIDAVVSKVASGQPVPMHGAVTQECGSLLPRSTVCFSSVAMICDLSGVACKQTSVGYLEHLQLTLVDAVAPHHWFLWLTTDPQHVQLM